jgi:hypothetical protein
MDTTTFYVRRGRRYYPVSQWDPELDRAMPFGDHLVSVRENSETRRHCIEPALAPMIAAGLLAEEAMSRAIHNAMELRPQSQPLTPRQRELLRELTDSMNGADARWSRASAQDAARAGVEAMIEEAQRIMQSAAAQRAYRDFLLVVELTRKEKSSNI